MKYLCLWYWRPCWCSVSSAELPQPCLPLLLANKLPCSKSSDKHLHTVHGLCVHFSAFTGSLKCLWHLRVWEVLRWGVTSLPKAGEKQLDSCGQGLYWNSSSAVLLKGSEWRKVAVSIPTLCENGSGHAASDVGHLEKATFTARLQSSTCSGC